MKRLIKIAFLLFIISLLGFTWPFEWQESRPNPERFGTKTWLEKQVKILEASTDGISANLLRLSLKAYVKAHKSGLVDNDLLTVIDYSKPSSERRLWVFDLKHGRTLFHTWVSHGKNTGDTYATSFSNKPGSLKSSLGVFITDVQPYFGGNGYSLRMRGLEAGINDNAYDRDIVIHGASYVSSDTIRHYGRAGRSWGCPAVGNALAKPIIDKIKSHSVVFAYYPDRNWLSHSKYLA